MEYQNCTVCLLGIMTPIGYVDFEGITHLEQLDDYQDGPEKKANIAIEIMSCSRCRDAKYVTAEHTIARLKIERHQKKLG